MKAGQQKDRAVLKELTQFACRLGASNERIVSATDISVEEDLANLCRAPQCENYGLSASCAPHAARPFGFRKLMKNF
jgi:predicted metal-binding protein